jgi:hypothetical protein
VIGTANGTGAGAFASSNVDLRTVANGGKIQNTVTGFLISADYSSGGSITGSITQTCNVASFNNSLSGATGTFALTGTNTIAAKTHLVITAFGSGATAAPTSATLSNGTATCSGTATLSNAVVSLVTVPADFVFTSDSLGTTLLNWEVASYSATTGVIQAYVNLSISHTSDTLFYISFGNSSVTTFQGNTQAAWNSGFINVLHFENIIITVGKVTSAFDSTININTVTNASSDLTSTASGAAGSALASPGSPTNSSELIGSGSSGSGFNNYPTGSSARTMEGFFNVLGNAFPSNASLGGWGSSSTGQTFLLFGCNACVTSGNELLVNAFGSGQRNTFTADSNWHGLAGTLPSGTTVNTIAQYLDGVLQTTTVYGSGTTVNTGTTGFNVGGFPGTTGLTWKGNTDEIRVSNVTRPVDWLLATKNNLITPGSFITASNARGGNMPPAIF